MKRNFERLTTVCARFTGRPTMWGICLVLANVVVAAYLSGDDHFLNGANLGLSIVTLLLLPILQATQNKSSGRRFPAGRIQLATLGSARAEGHSEVEAELARR
jgi:low affinity Fe/Cu permease